MAALALSNTILGMAKRAENEAHLYLKFYGG
jgi:hypothetical protein